MTSPAHSELVLLLCTAPTAEVANQLAEGLIEARLAACVAQTSIKSRYRWQGAVETANEIELKVKTTMTKAQAALDWLAEHHPYDVPELLCVPIMLASNAYTQWAKDQVEDPLATHVR